MSKQKYVSDTLKKRKKKRTKIKLYMFLILICVVLYGLVYIIRLPQLQITQVEITGLTILDKQTIQTKVDEQLQKNIFWFIPKSNIFLFSKRELYKNIIQDPAITHLVIKKRYFDGLYIEIEEHQKQTMYCRDDSHVECFYVNTEGMIYAQTVSYVIPEQETIIFSEDASLEIKKTILDTVTYRGVMQFIKSIAQKDIHIKRISIKNDGMIELFTSTDVKIIISIFDDFEKDFTNFVALFEQSILTKENFDQVEYIDLRFGNKVFYKNKTS